MNYSRCCEQPICTECFVQIKRVDPTVTNLTVRCASGTRLAPLTPRAQSEPVACPYCVEPEFGVTYRPPAIMNRREPDGSVSRADRNVRSRTPIYPGCANGIAQTSRPEVTPSPIDDLSSLSISPSSGRRKSVSASSASVVTVDHLHPDWQAKLDAVRATAARRANRRIVFRRVGDRLIPVGITSSRDVMAAAAAAEAGMAGASPGSGTEDPSGLRGLSRRNRRRGSGREPEVQQYLSGLAGQECVHPFLSVASEMEADDDTHSLEELMIMEAMRLSMLEEEERQKKEKAEREKAAAAGPIASTSTAAPAELPSIQPHASTSTQSTLPDALPPPLQPAPATSVRRSLPPGASLLTATAPAPPVTTDSTSKLLRQQSMAPSLAETEASEIDLDPGYQRLDDDED